ncbi:MAG: hypothetical protein WC091_04570 [Sulfuricellaceae bacterium]
MTRNEQVYTLAQDWVRWIDMRRFVGEPAQRNFLAQMVGEQPESSGEPCIPLNPEMIAFNIAVSSLPIGLFVPFVVVYCDYRPKPVKTLADGIGIERCQFYERAHLAANQAARTTRQLMLFGEQMRAGMLGMTPVSGS